MATIAVDLDGPVHLYSRGWHDGTVYDNPTPGALDGLQALMRDYAVFIHTTRNEEQAAAWLRGHGIPALSHADAGRPFFWDDRTRLLVSNRKLPALAYIDDRGIRFTDWHQALADVRRLCG